MGTESHTSERMPRLEELQGLKILLLSPRHDHGRPGLDGRIACLDHLAFAENEGEVEQVVEGEGGVQVGTIA